LEYSENDGAYWSIPVKVNDDGTTTSQFEAQAAIDQTTGDLAVTWYDPRNDPTAHTVVRRHGTVIPDGRSTCDPAVLRADATPPCRTTATSITSRLGACRTPLGRCTGPLWASTRPWTSSTARSAPCGRTTRTTRKTTRTSPSSRSTSSPRRSHSPRTAAAGWV